MRFRSLQSILTVVAVLSLPAAVFADEAQPVSAPVPATAPAAPQSPPITQTPATTTAPATTPAATTAPATTPAPASATTPAASFQKTCVDTWVEKNKGNVDFKNFGEKYCKCAETQQPLNTEEQVNKAIQVCMSRTLLQDAMDNLEETVGLAKVSGENIDEACFARWQLVYPSMDEKDKTAAKSYCTCAKPKLLELVKKSENMTDQDYATVISGIAASCSGHVGK